MPAHFSDSHVHLHWYTDVSGVVDRALAAQVDLIAAISIDLESSRRSIDIARRFSTVVAGVGFHPMFFDESLGDLELEELDVLAHDPAVGFVGEIGVDTVEGTNPLAHQLWVLERELAIAQENKLAVNLHLRGAIDEALDLISRVGLPERGAVFHYFAGDAALARRVVDLGLHLAVGKPITRVDNEALRQAVVDVPFDRILIETDSYPLSGRDTEPADVVLVAGAVAELKGCSIDEVAVATSANLRRLLGG